jgi:hypothetical protein
MYNQKVVTGVLPMGIREQLAIPIMEIALYFAV